MQKVKHKARGINPRIRTLADVIGLPIFRRNGELWLNGDLQLTYKYIDQKAHRRPATEEERIGMACSILQQVLDARVEWGTVGERYRRIWTGLRETLPKHRARHYTYYREPTLDCGWMFQSPVSPKWDMGICLCGLEPVRVSAETPDECLAKLAVDQRFLD